MKKIISLIALMLLFNTLIKAQIYDMSTNNGYTITACTGYFYDNISGNYAAGIDQTITFKSNSTTTTHIRVIFNQFDIDPSDTLYVYDGLNTSATLIGKYNNNNPLNAGQNIVQASISNTSGALTFRFKTDASNQTSGWTASFTCTPACQKIISTLDSFLTIPHPDSNYVDACMGDSITFSGIGVFPQNNTLYNQQNSSCTFHWDFGDGTTGTGQTIKHKYTTLKGYDIMLNITDSIGCVNTNALGARVRMAGFPNLIIIPLYDMCSKDSVDLSVGYSNNSNIIIMPFPNEQIVKANYDSVTFIPDGPNCPPGVTNASIVINNFLPDLTVTNASNIAAICVNIEHSFSGDLSFKIICPNGQNVVLDPNSHSGGAYLGEPYGGTNHGTYDNGCSPANNPSGFGWTYCWSEIYPNGGTTLDMLSSGGGGFGLTGNSIDSTNQLNHTNYIMPQNPLSGLIGCPLNGIWNLQIVDDYAIDNGYIFHWDIQLQTSQVSLNWTYNVTVDSVGFSGPLVTTINDSTTKIHPLTGGNFNIPITLYDDFGCKWDTSTNLTVVQTPIVNLGNDTAFCAGHSITLDAGSPGSTYQWNYFDINGSTNQTIITKDTVLSTGESFSYFYIVYVTNHNSNIYCTASDMINVTLGSIPPTPVINYQSGFMLTSSAAIGNQWYNATSGIVNNATSQTYVPLQNGYYYVIATVNGCSSDTSNHINFINAGIETNENSNGIYIYPNPTKDILTIETNSNNEQRLEIINLIGQTVYTTNINNKKTIINTSAFANGVYILKLSSDKETVVRKFVKE